MKIMGIMSISAMSKGKSLKSHLGKPGHLLCFVKGYLGTFIFYSLLLAIV